MNTWLVLLTGSGFFADAYALFVINLVVDMMNELTYEQDLTDSEFFTSSHIHC